MRRIALAALLSVTAGCAPTSFIGFSNGYDPVTTLTYALPSLAMTPPETRKAILPAAELPLVPKIRIASEDPAVVKVWEPADKTEVVRIQAIAPGATLVHIGNFPFQDWNPAANPVARAEWRSSLRRYVSPRPDDAAFRKISDAQLWATALRARSRGAIRIVAEEDRLRFD